MTLLLFHGLARPVSPARSVSWLGEGDILSSPSPRWYWYCWQAGYGTSTLRVPDVPLPGAATGASGALGLAFPWPDSDAGAAGCHRTTPVPAVRLSISGPGGLERAVHLHPVRRADLAFLWARAAYRTTGEVHEAIVGFKYQDEYYHHGRLVEWLTGGVRSPCRGRALGCAGAGAALSPTSARARVLIRPASWPTAWAQNGGYAFSIALYRYRETPSQVGLERKARWANMQAAFRLKPRFDVKGYNLLLVDDVFTTGATTNACAHVLAQAGAARLVGADGGPKLTHEQRYLPPPGTCFPSPITARRRPAKRKCPRGSGRNVRSAAPYIFNKELEAMQMSARDCGHHFNIPAHHRPAAFPG